MKEVTFSMDIRPPIGTNIEDAIASALIKRKYSQFDLNLLFNDISVEINKTTTYDEAMSKYKKYCSIRATRWPS